MACYCGSCWEHNGWKYTYVEEPASINDEPAVDEKLVDKIAEIMYTTETAKSSAEYHNSVYKEGWQKAARRTLAAIMDSSAITPNFDVSKVTRLTVIDYERGGLQYERYNADLEYELQDDKRTLKIWSSAKIEPEYVGKHMKLEFKEPAK